MHAFFTLHFLSCPAEHQGGSSPSHRDLEVTTVIAWRCTPWRTVPRLSTITCSVGWARGAMSALLDAVVEAQETGVSANRLSKTGSGGLTGTAPKARRETCQTWALGPPSPRWRCGSKREGLWLKSSSLLHPTLTTAGQVTGPTRVRVFCKVQYRAVELVILRNPGAAALLRSKIQAVTLTHGSQDSPNKGLKVTPKGAATVVDLGRIG